MAASAMLERPEEVASKVMRRVQVSKMTRTLQDRLALANVKIQNGWQDLSLDAIEPRIEERMRRKRPASSSNDTISDSASTTSSRRNGLASSPITEPLFSDDFPRSGGSLRHKRIRNVETHQLPVSGAATGRRTRGAAARQATWKKREGLPESSPIKSQKHARFPSNNISHLSLISETSTIADDPPSPEFSEEDDADLPISSFSVNASARIASSPPRTPPPSRGMKRFNQFEKVSWSNTPKVDDDGADLLMYLATSPSPAVNASNRRQTVIKAPSTPPHKSTPLPSSHMTPGTTGNGFLAFAPNTPGTFNFADFVNVTPSPGQGHWARTPVAGRTPGASARRRLDFDKLVPPVASPTMNRTSRSNGLGMDLGGELRT